MGWGARPCLGVEGRALCTSTEAWSKVNLLPRVGGGEGSEEVQVPLRALTSALWRPQVRGILCHGNECHQMKCSLCAEEQRLFMACFMVPATLQPLSLARVWSLPAR